MPVMSLSQTHVRGSTLKVRAHEQAGSLELRPDETAIRPRVMLQRFVGWITRRPIHEYHVTGGREIP